MITLQNGVKHIRKTLKKVIVKVQFKNTTNIFVYTYHSLFTPSSTYILPSGERSIHPVSFNFPPLYIIWEAQFLQYNF